MRALWDVPLFAEKTELRLNPSDERIIDKKEEKVILIEISCPWIDNRVVNTEEKTRKYGPLRLESKEQYPGYKITQYNIIMDVLDGYLEEVRESVHNLVEERNKVVLKKDAESHANKYSKHCKKYEDTR